MKKAKKGKEGEIETGVKLMGNQQMEKASVLCGNLFPLQYMFPLITRTKRVSNQDSFYEIVEVKTCILNNTTVHNHYRLNLGFKFLSPSKGGGTHIQDISESRGKAVTVSDLALLS